MNKEELIKSYINEAIRKGITIDAKSHTINEYTTQMNTLIDLTYTKIQITESEVEFI